MTIPLLEVDSLAVEYRRGLGKAQRVVDGVTFEIPSGKTLGLVGESGSGKSTIARAIVGLVPIAGGEVRLGGQATALLSRLDLSSQVQMVFQDPFSSLNPARTVGQTIAEPVLAQRRSAKSEIREMVGSILVRVGLDAEAARRYPSQFSGGQRQRIAVARALILRPRLVICDEPVSALDLSVQAQILNLLQDLQDELALSYLFISHDLAVVQRMSDEVAVIYGGLIMERGETRQVTNSPVHPYTQGLMKAAPAMEWDIQKGTYPRRVPLAQQLTDNGSERTGCPFAPRCPLASVRCRAERPVLLPYRGSTSHHVACHERASAPQGGPSDDGMVGQASSKFDRMNGAPVAKT